VQCRYLFPSRPSSNAGLETRMQHGIYHPLSFGEKALRVFYWQSCAGHYINKAHKEMFNIIVPTKSQLTVIHIMATRPFTRLSPSHELINFIDTKTSKNIDLSEDFAAGVYQSF
jgi:hypothetical protein